MITKKPSTYLTSSTLLKVPKDQQERYIKKMGLNEILLGLLFAIMGQVEAHLNISTPLFITLYVILASVLLGQILVLNKKFLGTFR